MLRSTGLALILAALALSALAGCNCSTGPAGPLDASHMNKPDTGPHYDDAGNIIIEPDDASTVPPHVDAGMPTVKVPPGHFKDPGNTLDGVSQTDAGYIVLDQSQVSLHFAWLANPDGFGSVSKIDTTTGKEVARYVAAFPLDGKGQVNGLTWNSQQHISSRTAVDLNGDVWLANRAFYGMANVTKIANAIQDCVPRSPDGVLKTSSDKNGNGVIDDDEWIRPTDPNDPTQYDDCMLFTTPIGTKDQPSVARALAIDTGIEGSPGNVWVGLWCGLSGTPNHDQMCLCGDATPPCDGNHYDTQGGAFVKLSPTTGEMVDITPGNKYLDVPIRPYGAAVDAQNRVWMSHYSHTWTAGINANTGAVIQDPAGGPFKAPQDWGGYGVTVQVTKDNKSRVWIANINQTAKVSRFNVDTSDWTQFDFGPQLGTERYGYGRGIAVDDKGIVWMSSYVDSPTPPYVEQCRDANGNAFIVQLVGINSDDGSLFHFPAGNAVVDLSRYYVAQGLEPPCTGIGVGMDNNNRVWVASGNGYATGVDRTTGAVMMRSPDVGDLYTYSDFTGYTLRTFTAPQGSFKTIFAGCGASVATHWKLLSWDATVPAQTQLKFFVRSAATKADLNQPGTKLGPFSKSPTDLQAAKVPDGNYLQVEAQMVSLDKTSTPTLKSVAVSFECDVTVN